MPGALEMFEREPRAKKEDTENPMPTGGMNLGLNAGLQLGENSTIGKRTFIAVDMRNGAAAPATSNKSTKNSKSKKTNSAKVPGCSDKVEVGYFFLLLSALLVYIAIGIIAGKPGNGDLKKSVHCCAPFHIVFGAIGWWFPPLFLFFVFYQIADHYGFWWKEPLYQFHDEQESWMETFTDVLEYFVGLFLVEVCRWVRPLRFSCMKLCWLHWRRTGRCTDAPPFCIHNCCTSCVDRFEDVLEEHTVIKVKEVS